MAEKSMIENDPLKNKNFKAPGVIEMIKRDLLGKRRPLDCIQVEVTSFCGGRCIYCPHTTMKESWKSRHISPEIFAALWKLMRISERVHLQGWGEPLLHPRFFDFAALARKADCQVSSTSCGLIMNDEIAYKLAHSGIDTLAFSLVGTDSASNDSGRAGVPFEKVCSAIRMVKSAVKDMGYSPLDIHFAYLLLADRVDAVKNLPDLMEELDISTAVISSLDYIADSEQTPLAFAPHERQKIAEARNILQELADTAAKMERNIVFALPGSKAIAHTGGCRENITGSLYIDAEGMVSPCVYLNVPDNAKNPNRRIFGSVLETDVLEIWENQDFQAFRESLAKNTPDSACQNCPKRFEIVGRAHR